MREASSVILVHSHPGSSSPLLSSPLHQPLLYNHIAVLIFLLDLWRHQNAFSNILQHVLCVPTTTVPRICITQHPASSPCGATLLCRIIALNLFHLTWSHFLYCFFPLPTLGQCSCWHFKQQLVFDTHMKTIVYMFLYNSDSFNWTFILFIYLTFKFQKYLLSAINSK